MAIQPGADFRLLVCGIVVEDDVDGLICGHFSLDGIEEADELLMPMALQVTADHRAIEGVERGEQGSGAVALVVVRHGRPRPRFSGNPG